MAAAKSKCVELLSSRGARIGGGIIFAGLYTMYRLNRAGPWGPTISKLLGLSCGSDQGGEVEKGYESLQEAFKQNFLDGLEQGAQFVVFVDGKKVVDLWGSAETNPVDYNGDTAQIVWSNSKSVTALVVARLVGQGLLAYDQPIATYWPEFAKNGKENIRVEDLMRHEAGLDVFAKPVDREMAADSVKGGHAIADLIVETTPEWSEESRRCYHGQTRGWVINELVRRVDPAGRTVGQILKEDLTDPLGLSQSLRMGIPRSEQKQFNLTSLRDLPKFTGLCKFLPMLMGFLDPVTKEMFKYFAKGSFAHRRWLTKSSNWGEHKPEDGPGCGSAEFYIEFEAPSCNVQSNARALATLFASMTSDRGPVAIPESTMEQALVTTPECIDVGIGLRTTFSAGGWAKNIFGYYPKTQDTSSWYGWAGWGGSMVQFNRDLRVAWAYVPTAMEQSLSGDLRTIRLVKALEGVLVDVKS